MNALKPLSQEEIARYERLRALMEWDEEDWLFLQDCEGNGRLLATIRTQAASIAVLVDAIGKSPYIGKSNIVNNYWEGVLSNLPDAARAHVEEDAKLRARIAELEALPKRTPAPKGYSGWTCGKCNGPVAGRYSVCEACGHGSPTGSAAEAKP